MKTKITFLIFSLVLFFTTACQKEIVQVTQPDQMNQLIANTNVATLVQRTATKDGSKDNIIDHANCISVKLPVTVVVNGQEIVVNTVADYQLIETVFDEFDDDIDDLDIIFPIVIILNDFTEITINNSDELENYTKNCNGENELDDDIECLDFVYPITVSVFNTSNELAETITVENDEQFYKFIGDLEDYHIVQITFPITVILYDGTEKVIETMDALEQVIDQVKDMCDEDDDNDYNDDDCMQCTNEQITQMLLTCSWVVDRLEIGNIDNTDQYINYVFTFLEDGTIKAVNNGNEIFGTWIIENSDVGILLKVNFANLTDFNFNWILYEIDSDYKVDFRFENNRLKMEKLCEGARTELITILNQGNWLVANFNNEGINETVNFNDFAIDFLDDFTVTATKGLDVVNGTYSVVYDSGKLKLVLDFGATTPFDQLNDDWVTVSIQNNRVEVKYVSSDTNLESNLVFEKMI